MHKIMSKNQKRDNMKEKKFLHNAPSKRLFWNGIHSFLRRTDTRGSAAGITVSNAYRKFAC